VALATGATAALLARRDGWSGLLLGLGGAAKVYPLLLLIPFAAQRIGERDRRGLIRLLGGAAIAWVAVNLPFALAAPEGWATFFRFNAERPAEYDSVWRVLCAAGACVPTAAVNVLGVAIALAGAAMVWRWKVARDPDTPAWTIAFPLLAMFLLVNKIWSPQYVLWLLPWFALVARSPRPYLAEQASEALVYAARFSYFGRLRRGAGIGYGGLAAALLLRSAALVWCIVAWFRSPASVAPARSGVARS
jgi:uncharacterized membrane protein